MAEGRQQLSDEAMGSIRTVLTADYDGSWKILQVVQSQTAPVCQLSCTSADQAAGEGGLTGGRVEAGKDAGVVGERLRHVAAQLADGVPVVGHLGREPYDQGEQDNGQSAEQGQPPGGPLRPSAVFGGPAVQAAP